MKKLVLAVLLFGLHGQLLALKMDITVTYDRAKAGDSLFLEYYDTFFPRIIKPKMINATQDSGGCYRFCVDVDGPVRFSILKRLDIKEYPNLKGSNFRYNTLLYDYPWKGDGELKVQISKRLQSAPQSNSPLFDFTYAFEGHRALVYKAKALADSALNFTKQATADRENLTEPQAGNIIAGIVVLDSLRSGIDESEYQLLKAEIIYGKPSEKLYNIKNQILEMSHQQRRDALNKLDQYFDRGIDERILAESQSYVKFWFERQMIGIMASGKKYSPDSLIADLLKGPQTKLTDRITTYALLFAQIQDTGKYLPELRKKIGDPDCIAVLNSINTRGKGNPMFDFEFPDANGKLVRLSDFKGKTVFLDFWYTGCGACTYFYTKVLSQVEKELHGKDIEFVTVSIDAGKDFWLKSVRSGKYTSDLATNLYTGGVGANHHLLRNYGIDSYPTFVVVDKMGKIHSFNAKELHIRDSANLVNILKQVSTQ